MLNKKQFLIFALVVCLAAFAISGLVFADRVLGVGGTVGVSSIFNMGGKIIANMGTPINTYDAATKNYVDSTIVPISDNRLWNYSSPLGMYAVPGNPEIFAANGGLFITQNGFANWNTNGYGFYINAINGGDLSFYGKNGGGLNLALYLRSSNGFVGIGKQPDYSLDVAGVIHGQELSISGSKNFMIDHPLDPENKQLVHSTLEGPEVGVYYRGEAQLQNGQTEVVLPSYFEVLTRKENRTVLLTPKFDSNEPISNLAASAVENGKFSARAIDSQNPSQKFFWEVKAVRADIAPLEVERLKTDGERRVDKK